MADRMRTVEPAMKKSLLVLFGVCGLVFLCAEAWAWQANVSGTASDGQFNATTVDGTGNVIAAGVTNNTDTGNDFTVAKFNGATGAELWRQVISGGSGTGLVSDVANAVAVDGAGNVVAAGVIWHTSPTSRAKWSDMLVVKLDGASGTELWRQVITGSFNDQDPLEVEDVANAVAIDGSGNVVVGGRINYTAAVVKLHGAIGAELWRKIITGSAGGRTRVDAVTVDGAGNVVAAGLTFNTGTGRDFTVVKFDGSSGTELWRQVIEGGLANAIAIDAATGNVGATGSTSTPDTGNDFTVAKFDGANGAELWRQVINGSSNGSDFANAVMIDGIGNVVAVGTIDTTHFPGAPVLHSWLVTKFDGGSGAELWRSVTDSTDDTIAAKAVAVDGTGNVAVTGVTNPGALRRFTVKKFDGTTGAELWRRDLASDVDSPSGEGRSVAVDKEGNVIAAGYVSFIATVAKLGGADGGDFTPPDTEPPTATITAPANGAIVSGTITVSADASDNVGVAEVQFKLDGAPLGAEVKAAPYAVTWDTTTAANGPHQLTAVARDSAGNQGASPLVGTVVVNLP